MQMKMLKSIRYKKEGGKEERKEGREKERKKSKETHKLDVIKGSNIVITDI